MNKVRIDVALCERGLASSREKAQALILAGQVEIGGLRAAKAGQKVDIDAQITVRQKLPYVSRGGLKLEHALQSFALDPNGLVVIDVGASTGGFTDCLLQRGARKVYAIDVGRGQLDWSLRQDPRVVVMERTNIRHLQALPELADLAVVDVSFISLKLVLPVVRRLLRSGGQVVALIKPQFEVGREQVGKGGVVRDTELHRQVLMDTALWAQDHGYVLRGMVTSPILGPAGNREFFMWIGTEGSGAALSETVERCSRSIGRCLTDSMEGEV